MRGSAPGPQHWLRGVAKEAQEPGGERWCNGEETILAVPQALIKPGAGSQGGWHHPCGAARHASVWVGVFPAGRSAPPAEGREGAAIRAGTSRSGRCWPSSQPYAGQGRSSPGAALAMPWLAQDMYGSPLLSPMSGLPDRDTPLPRTKQDPRCSVPGKQALSVRELSVAGCYLGRKKRNFQGVSGQGSDRLL